ncbi:SusC/RagA family TonB-linked outer membrane protein [Sinomicrobium sp.]
MKIHSILQLILAVMVFPVVYGQEIAVKGTVTDEEGVPLPGVNILKKNTTEGVMTDFDGAYTIDAAKGDVLIFSFVGMKTREITIADNNTINVVMSADASQLDEVVVMGYGTLSRRKVTASVSNLSGEKLENVPVNSLGDALKGKVAGLRVYSTNNEPGQNPTFRIRGGSSINQSDAPIVVVDGMVREISGINPNDIESIEVLKDAASAAIYGARASNGIVMITTKKGKKQAPTILFETAVAAQSPVQRFDLMNSRDYLYYMRRAVAEGKYPARNFQNGFSMSSANTDTSMWTTRYLQDGESIPEGWQSMPDPLDPSKTLIFEDNDFQKRFFDSSFWSNYYLGVNGGGDRVVYAASAGYTSDDGVGIGTGYDRFTMRGNMDINITDKLTFSTGYDFMETDLEDYPGNKRNLLHRGLSTPNTHRIYNVETGLPEPGVNGSTPTPDWYKYYYDRSQITKRSIAFGKLVYDVTDDLSLTGMLTNYNRHTRNSSFIKANEYNGLRPTEEAFSETHRLNFQAYANYSKKFGDHEIDAVVGTDYMKDKYNAFGASVTGASSDKVPTLSAGAIPGAPTSSRTEEVLISYFGRLNYGFKDKYLLSFTARADGSSKFAKNNRWGFFPAASAGWIVSEEDFWKSEKFNFLKIRTSYGLTGNNAIGLYDAYGNYNSNGLYNDMATIVTSTIPNQDLQWETTRQFDIGLDLGLLDNRIVIAADYFNKITDNLIFEQPLPNTTGYASIMTNVGKVNFWGGELHLTSENIKTPDFSWTTDITYSYVMNEVRELPDNGRDKNRIGGITLGDGSAYGGIAEGERMYRIYGYVVDRILETTAEADAAMYDVNSNGFRFADGQSIPGRKAVGDYEWVNRPGSSQRDGKDQINAEDQFLLGYTIPHSTGGISNTFKYKNLSLNIFMDYAIGHTVQNYLQERYFMGTFNYNYTLTNEVKKAWTQPGDQTKYAKFFANDADDGSRNYSRASNIFSEKGDFLAIREVMLTYEFPQSLLDKFKLTGASVYLVGNNLHFFTRVNGVSPESGTSTTYGTGFSSYPSTRKVGLGLKITL